MIKSVSKTSRPNSAFQSTSIRAVVAGLLIALLAFANLSVMAGPAKAISVDASQATFNFDYANKATVISGADGASNNAIIKYTNITDTPLSGISIDAVIKTTLTNSTVSNYDSIGNASSNVDYFQANGGFTGTYGTMDYKFEFYESGTYTGVGTGIPVILNNVSITSIDLDGSTGGTCQFTDFTGFQSYVLSQSSSINVLTNATDARVPVGTTRFIATSCVTTYTNRVEDAVQVKFDSVSTFTARFGLNGTGSTNYFGIAFEPMPALFVGATFANPVGNPSNQAPTSTDTTRYYVNGESSIVQLQDFGIYSDPDGNPFNKVKITTLPTTGSLEKFVNGSWVAVSLNDEILVSDISNGNLRYTGTVDNSLQFKVSDGTQYSASAYTMTLLVSNQSQTITFNNPGTKTPTAPTFASGATSSSGLTVTLTSLTPGVCTVSGLNIDPITSGTCTIVATQSGNSSYGAAAPVTQTFPISTLTAQTITAPNPGDQTWAGSSYTVSVTPTASSNLTVSLISLSPSVCTVSGQVITILGPGNCSIRNVQSGNSTYAAAPQVEYTFVVGASVTEYTITYNENGKSGGSAPAIQTGNGSVTLASNSGSLVKTGYEFTGWNTAANGSGTHYAVSGAYNLTADVTLYAEWTALSYTITYDENDSTGGSAPANTTGYGTKTLASNSGTLVKTGYSFTGWNTAADGSGTHYAVSATYSLTADVTLYAEWTPLSYSITYNGNGNLSGSVPANTTGYGSVTLAANTGTLAKTGFSLSGWNTLANGSGTSYALSDTYNLTGSVTLYAEWTALSFTILYDDNESTGGSTPANTTGYGTKTLASNSGTLVKTGYIFRGWNTMANGSGTRYLASTTYNLLADVTLYAEWTLIPAVIYSANGATSGQTPADIPAGDPITIDPNTGNLIRAGYRFLGWNTEPDGSGTRYAAGMTPILPEGTTLYAEWQPVSNGLANTGGDVAPVVPLGLSLLAIGAVLSTRRKRIRKH